MRCPHYVFGRDCATRRATLAPFLISCSLLLFMLQFSANSLACLAGHCLQLSGSVTPRHSLFAFAGIHMACSTYMFRNRRSRLSPGWLSHSDVATLRRRIGAPCSLLQFALALHTGPAVVLRTTGGVLLVQWFDMNWNRLPAGALLALPPPPCPYRLPSLVSTTSHYTCHFSCLLL